MTTTRLLIASLCLALAACAGSIDEPGQGGGDDNADAPDDNTDAPDDNTDDPDDNTDAPVAPTFTATVLPTLTEKCASCHAGLAFNFSGSAQEVYDRVMAQPNVVDVDNPANSLLFKKPTGGVAHGGGAILAADSAQATAILDWIDGGANL